MSQKFKSSGTGTDLVENIVSGTIMVHASDKFCRAIYYGEGASHTQNLCVCMEKMPCQGRDGGQGHKRVIIKRDGQAKVGYYQGAYYHRNMFAT